MLWSLLFCSFDINCFLYNKNIKKGMEVTMYDDDTQDFAFAATMIFLAVGVLLCGQLQ